MSDKIILIAILLFFPLINNCELIKSEKLKEQKEAAFTIKRNIFSPQKIFAGETRKEIEKKIAVKNAVLKKEKDEQENKVIATVFYEGFLLKDNQIYALLKVNDQFYISRVGDRLPGNILIKEIFEKKVMLEIESSEVSVSKKGEKNVN